MIRHTSPYRVSEIFTDKKDIFYYIPKYQREYTWGQREWNLLFNDIIENDNGYFLGSIICVDTSLSAMQDVKLEVIDGQQRITSLSILLIALYEKINSYKDGFDEDQITDLNNIKRELIIRKNGESKSRLTPQIQNNNKDDYFSLLCEKKLLSGFDKKSNAGNRRIYKAYNYFSSMIDKYIEEEKIEDENLSVIKKLFEIVFKFNSAILVSIEVETHKDAYMLFESLNNRGIPLSAIDLIKNILISISDEKNKSEECYNKWKKILSYLSDEYSVQERFFRQYYNAYREELNKGFPSEGKTKYYLGYLATKTTLLDIYEKLVKHDYEKFLDDIEEKAQTYSIIINNSNDDERIESLENPLLNLDRIQGSPSYLLLLYIFSKKNELELDNNIIINIINYLTTFFVRRNITDIPNTRNLNKIFMDIVSEVSSKKGEEVYNTIISILKIYSSDDTIFEEKLRGQMYFNNVESTRFLLCYYEDKFKTNEIYTDLWKKDKNNRYIWTIEHIFPEGENIPGEWIDMIADGNKELAYEYWNKYVHTLGNLTITGYNQNLSNLSFDKKKYRLNKDGNNIGYKNGLKLNEDVENQNVWKKSNIKERTNKLVKMFMEDFKL